MPVVLEEWQEPEAPAEESADDPSDESQPHAHPSPRALALLPSTSRPKPSSTSWPGGSSIPDDEGDPAFSQTYPSDLPVMDFGDGKVVVEVEETWIVEAPGEGEGKPGEFTQLEMELAHQQRTDCIELYYPPDDAGSAHEACWTA